METSDSEYFESADEDFETDEFNKNRTSLKDSSVLHPSKLSKEANKVQILSDVNQNKKENTDSKNVNQDNKINLQHSIAESNSTTEIKKVPDPLTADDKNIFRKDDKEFNQTGLSSNTSDSIQDDTDGNLWNEGEGWGVDDECDTKNADINITKTDCINTLSDNSKKSNQNEAPPKVKSLEGKNMWDNEEWDNWESVNEKIYESNIKPDVDNTSSSSNQIWKGWGNWGVTSILSTASQGVSTLTNSVTQGLSTVLETSIGAPDPGKLAALNKDLEKDSLIPAERSEKISSNPDEECENKNILKFGISNIGSLVSGVSKLVETTSTKVISGGLDTLETIGKKTMEVIQEGDPGLKRKRAFLNLEGDKPVLSQVLREAKEKTEQENKALQEKHFIKKVNYESIFDDHQGLVHLEALEMLSKQCDMKLQLLIESNSGNALTEIQETLDQVKELCELPDEEEDEQIPLEELKDRLKSAVEEIDINITYDRLISMWEETECWLNDLNLNICDENEIHQQAVETLAQLTAIAVEQFHKGGELLLIKDHHSTADEADSLVQ